MQIELEVNLLFQSVFPVFDTSSFVDLGYQLYCGDVSTIYWLFDTFGECIQTKKLDPNWKYSLGQFFEIRYNPFL